MGFGPRVWVAAVRQAALSALQGVGLSVGRSADARSVRALVHTLRPVVTEHELVRVGAAGDGGYLVPDDLDGIAACFSPGVDDRATFERDLVDRGIPCLLADGSVTAPPFVHEKISFRPTFLGVTRSGDTITLDDWVTTAAPPSGDLLLQMDIEGAEWPVLLHVSDDVLRRFRIIVVELHDLTRILDRDGLPVLRAMLDRLLAEFHVVHLHPNNSGGRIRHGDVVVPRTLEMTLLRRDRATVTGPAVRFPHPLDRPNSPHVPDLRLPAAWHAT